MTTFSSLNHQPPVPGTDIGGTGIKGGVVDVETGSIVGGRRHLPTPHPSTPEAVAETVAHAVAALSTQIQSPPADTAGLAEVRYGAGKGQAGPVLVTTLGTGIGSAMIFDNQLIPNTDLGHLQLHGQKAETMASAVTGERNGTPWVQYAAPFQDYLSHAEFLLAPELIIVGGVISGCSSGYLPLLRLRTTITAARLRDNAGIVGGALRAVTANQ